MTYTDFSDIIMMWITVLQNTITNQDQKGIIPTTANCTFRTYTQYFTGKEENFDGKW